MSAETISPAFAEFADSAELDLTKVLALQSLLMGEVRTIARQKGRKTYVRGNPRAHAYGVLHNCVSGIDDPEAIYTGGKDRYLGVRVNRLGHRLWGMGILLHANTMSRERLSEQGRTVYRFRWNDTIAVGRKEVSYFAPYSDSAVTVQKGLPIVMEPPDTDGFSETLPLIDADLQVLIDEAKSIAEAAVPRAA